MTRRETLAPLLVAWLAACALAATPEPATDFVQVAPPTQSPVEFKNDQIVLAGTLYLPGTDATVPGVVILGGSERGPRTPMKHRLAAHFAACGVAALIYDSPGTGRSTGNALTQTRDGRADEALAALRYLAARDRVQPDHVGIAGISEGALVTLLAAARSENVAFAIPISGGFGSSMTELARYRIETQGHLRGLPPDEIQRALLLDEILFALLGGPERAEWRLVELKTAQWPEEAWAALIDGVRTARAGVSPEERGAGWDAIRGALGGWRNEAWYELAVIDAERFDRLLAMTPDQFDAFLKSNRLAAGDMDKVAREVVAYAKIRCPILAVWGENDEFLPPHVSAAFLRSCLAGTGHHDATYEIVPGASHILTTSADDATFAAGYPSLLTDWVSERFGASATP